MCRSLSKVNDGSCAATLREHCCKSLLWPREPTAAALPRTASRTKSLQEIFALFLAVGSTTWKGVVHVSSLAEVLVTCVYLKWFQ